MKSFIGKWKNIMIIKNIKNTIWKTQFSVRFDIILNNYTIFVKQLQSTQNLWAPLMLFRRFLIDSSAKTNNSASCKKNLNVTKKTHNLHKTQIYEMNTAKAL